MSFLSTAVQEVLDRGQFCAVAAMTPRGPHCTPLVFANSGARLWLTTSRRSVKARAWRTDPSVAGLVRSDDLAVTFTGTVRTYDALDRRTWAAAVAGATSIARATATFSTKNARFFAGYAVDAKQIPLAWTPPGRVFVGIDLERTALVEAEGVQEGRGRWGGAAGSHPTFRRAKGVDALAQLPVEIAEGIGTSGEGALAVVGERGLVVLPVRWRAESGALYAILPAETLALAGADADAPVALMLDRASVWRARDMVGAMFQGEASFFVEGEVGSGATSLRGVLGATTPAGAALVRVRSAPRRVVEGLEQRQRGRAMTTTVEYSVEVDAPPEIVWAVTSDPRGLPAWERLIESVRMPPGGLAQGVEFEVLMAFIGRARHDHVHGRRMGAAVALGRAPATGCSTPR